MLIHKENLGENKNMRELRGGNEEHSLSHFPLPFPVWTLHFNTFTLPLSTVNPTGGGWGVSSSHGYVGAEEF